MIDILRAVLATAILWQMAILANAWLVWPQRSYLTEAAVWVACLAYVAAK